MSVRMRGFKRYTPLKAALKLVMSNLRYSAKEEISFKNALGRVLAEDAAAKNFVPPFSRSAVDGFAVRASNTFRISPSKPKTFKVIGSVRAGVLPRVIVNKGEAAKLMTGAPMPEGADAVVMVEHTKPGKRRVRVFSSVTPGKNVSKRGEDVRIGVVFLNRGKILQPHDIGMLAAAGVTKLKVFRKPKVAIIATGGELTEPGVKIPPAKIIDSNSYSLAAAVEKCGGDPVIFGRVVDDEKSIKNVILRASDYDVVLISGGSSVGEFDFVPGVISKIGELKFHGVSIRPGGPTAFGIVNRVPVFSLAGFPVATLVAFHMLVRPYILAMQGLPENHGRRAVTARLARDVSSTLGRIDVVRVKLREAESGTLADPIMITGSSILSSMTSADGFVMVPENAEGLRKGTSVEVELF